MTEHKEVDTKETPENALEVPSLPKNPQLDSNGSIGSEKQENQPQPKVKSQSYPQNNGFSPSGNSSTQPVVTQALKNALYSAKDRMFILTLEQDLIQFISSNTDSYLLRPMNSYYRLLTHQTAEYYGLGHSLHNDGNSILVFKNFGAEINLPRSLSSIPYDFSLPIHTLHPQFHAAHLQHHQTAGFIPSGGSPQFGYIPTHPQQGQQPFGYPVPPMPHLPNIPQPPYSSHSGSVNNRSPASAIGTPVSDSSKKDTPNTQFKLMKRTSDEKEKNDDVKTDDVKKDGSDAKDSNDLEEPVALESARASRESEYQRARERIFGDGDDEEEEDEEEENTTYSKKTSTSPDIPRIIPQQHHQAQQPQLYPSPQQSLQHLQQQQQQQQMPQYPYTQAAGPFPIPQPYYYQLSYPPGVIPPQGMPQFAPDGASQGFIPNQFFYPQHPQQHQHSQYRRHKNYNPNYRKNYNNNNNHYNNNNNYNNNSSNNNNNNNNSNNVNSENNNGFTGGYNNKKQVDQEDISNDLDTKLRIDESGADEATDVKN